MPTQIRMTPQQIADLVAIRELGAERVGRVVDHLRRLNVTPLCPTDLQQDFATALDDESTRVALRRVAPG